MKAFLINPNYPMKNKLLFPVPPLGLALIAAVLENEGLIVKAVDQFASNQPINSLVRDIINFNPDIVGFGILTPSITHTEDIVSALKQAGYKGLILFGNIHPTLFSDDLLKSEACDIVVLGEAEETIKELVIALKNNSPLTEINGIHYRNNNGVIIKTPSRNQISDLNTLPFPAWHLFDLKYYKNAPMLQIYGLALPVQASRGCPKRCSFCGQELFFKKVTYRSIESVIAEIEYLYEKFNIEYFVFTDANFPISKKYGISFCKSFMKSKAFPHVKWSSEIKVDMLDEELAKAMKESGCYLLEFGFEVGDPRILKKTNKNTSIEDGKKAVELSHKNNILVLGLFMIGFKNESVGSIFRTFFYAMKLKCDMAKFNIVIPLPGTQLFKKHSEILLKNFNPETFSSWYRPKKKDDPLIQTVPGALPPKKLMFLQSVGMLLFYARPSFIIKKFLSKSLKISDIKLGAKFILKELFKTIFSL